MPVFDIIVLSAIVAVFVTFGIVLAFLTWYCSDERSHAHRGADNRKGHNHDDWGVVIDD